MTECRTEEWKGFRSESETEAPGAGKAVEEESEWRRGADAAQMPSMQRRLETRR